MNKPNNKRSRNTDEAIIHAAFAAMVEGKKPVSKITVREICERAQINRSTFYAHYMDVYDLFEKVESQMAQMFQENFRSFEKSGESWDFLLAMERVFQFIYEYRDFFGLYFREAGRVSTIIYILVDPFQEQIHNICYNLGSYRLALCVANVNLLGGCVFILLFLALYNKK